MICFFLWCSVTVGICFLYFQQVRAAEQTRAAPPPLHTCFGRQARVSLEGVSLSLSEIRIVDGKFACYKITVTPAAGAKGARWEVCLGWAGRDKTRQHNTRQGGVERSEAGRVSAHGSISSCYHFIRASN